MNIFLFDVARKPQACRGFFGVVPSVLLGGRFKSVLVGGRRFELIGSDDSVCCLGIGLAVGAALIHLPMEPTK